MLGYRALGPLTVEIDGDAANIGGPRQRRLLAILLIHRDDVVSAGRIAEAVFAGEPTEAAETTLRSYISRLRKALPGDNGSSPLQTLTPGYSLAVADDEFDVGTFERLIREGAAHLTGGDAISARASLRAALDCWHGEPYAEFADEDWAMPEAQRLGELRLVALEHLADADLACGEHARVVSDLETLIVARPLREGFRARLMLALFRSGRQADSLRAYQDYRSVLAEELGLDPSRELIELERRILDQDPALQLSEPPGEPLRGYRLRERLGRGRDGTVFAAELPGVARDIAMRIYPAEIADRVDFVRTFEEQASQLASLHHPAIVPIFDYWREPGAAYLAMRRLRGGTLRDRLESGPLGAEEAAALIAPMGAAIAAAAEIGVSHGRLDPDTVLFDEDGRAVVSDFALGSSAPVAPWGDIRDLASLAAACVLGTGPGAASIDELAPHVRETITEGRNAIAGSGHTLLSYTATITEALTGRSEPPDTTRPNPYMGLRAFEEADARNFFGRDEPVDDLLRRLDRDDLPGRLLIVVGGSGSGKSSVVRAGLMPRLRDGAAGAGEWLVTAMMPGSSPFKELAEALSRVSVDVNPGVVEDLSEGPSGIDTVLRRSLPAQTELLLVIDQLEELFTLAEPQAQQAFIDGVLDAVKAPDSRLRVVATLRADYYDRPLQHQRLGPALHGATVTIPPMSAAEIEAAIVGPAHRIGAAVDPGVVAELVTSVIDQPNALPTLQFALYELAEARPDRGLTLDGMRTLGGVEGAIASRAESLYRSLDNQERSATRAVFQRLVSLDGEGEPTRRRAGRSELARVGRWEILERWVEARLLTVSRDPESREETIEVAHEALLSAWPRFEAWVDEDRDAIRLRGHLADAGKAWEANDRDTEYLYRGARLSAVEDWAHAHPAELSETESAFLDAAQAHQEGEIRAQRRTNRRLRGLLAGVGIALVVTLIAAVLALDQRDRADTAATAAATQAANADTARMHATVESIAGEDQRLALLLAAEAYRREASYASIGALQTALTARPGFLGYVGDVATTPIRTGFAGDGSIIVGTTEALHVFDDSGQSLRHEIPYAGVGRVATAPGQPVVLTTDGEEAVLFDVESGDEVTRVTPESLWGVWLTPAGDIVVSHDSGGATVFDQAGDVVGRVPDEQVIRDVDVSYDGRTLATASGDPDGFRVWDYATFEQLPRPEATVFGTSNEYGEFSLGGPTTVAFSPDDRHLAAGYPDGHIVIWDTETWEIDQFDRSGEQAVLLDSRILPQEVEIIDTDPLRVVALSNQGLVHWSLAEGFEVSINRDPSVPIASYDVQPARDLAFDPEGSRYLAVSDLVEMWSSDDRGLIAQGLGQPALNELGVANDGSFLVTQTSDAGRVGEIHKRDLGTGEERLITDDGYWGASLSPDDSVIVTAGPVEADFERSQLRLWDAATLHEIAPPLEVPGGPERREFSPDGRYLAIGWGLRIRGLSPRDTAGRIEIYELTDTGLVLRAEITDFPEMSDGDVWALLFSPDGTRLFAQDGRAAPNVGLAEWSVPDGDLIRGPEDVHALIEGSPRGATTDGSQYAWRSTSTEIVLVDQETLEAVGDPFLGAEGGAHGFAKFNDDDSLMFTMAGGATTMWDVEGRREIGQPFQNQSYEGLDGINVLHQLLPPESPLGFSLITTTPNQLLAWNLHFETWPDIACQAAGRNLTVGEWERFGPDEPYEPACAMWPSGAD